MEEVKNTLENIPKENLLTVTINYLENKMIFERCKLGTIYKFTEETKENIVKIITSKDDNNDDFEILLDSIFKEIFNNENFKIIENQLFFTLIQQILNKYKDINEIKKQFQDAVLFFIHGEANANGKSNNLPIIVNYCDPPISISFNDEKGKYYMIEGGSKVKPKPYFNLDGSHQKKINKKVNSCIIS